jgi:outer membrane protein assembly factor BamB
VYVGCSGPGGGAPGSVFALDVNSGSFVWSAATLGPVVYPPSLAEDRGSPGSFGTVLVGCGSGTLYALEGASGQHVWALHGYCVPATALVVMAPFDVVVVG